MLRIKTNCTLGRFWKPRSKCGQYRNILNYNFYISLRTLNWNIIFQKSWNIFKKYLYSCRRVPVYLVLKNQKKPKHHIWKTLGLRNWKQLKTHNLQNVSQFEIEKKLFCNFLQPTIKIVLAESNLITYGHFIVNTTGSDNFALKIHESWLVICTPK